GPDTATRTRTLAQVKLRKVLNGNDANASVDLNSIWTYPGTLDARYVKVAGSAPLDNLLYRVEVIAAKRGAPTLFRWSRENASVVASWNGGGGAFQIDVTPTASAGILDLAAGQWLELTDDVRE